MRKNIIRVATIAVLGVAPLVAATTSAQAGGAGDDYFVKTATTEWLDRGSVPGLLGGNVHRGVISTSDDQATPGWDNLNGWLEAWTCPAGAPVPPLFSRDDPEAPPTTCTFQGARELTFSSGAVTYGKKLRSAHITGTAIAADPSGTNPAVLLPVDVTLRAEGRAETYVDVNRYVEDDGTKVTIRSTIVHRTATVSGTVGTLGLGDEASDVTESDISSQQEVFRRS